MPPQRIETLVQARQRRTRLGTGALQSRYGLCAGEVISVKRLTNIGKLCDSILATISLAFRWSRTLVDLGEFDEGLPLIQDYAQPQSRGLRGALSVRRRLPRSGPVRDRRIGIEARRSDGSEPLRCPLQPGLCFGEGKEIRGSSTAIAKGFGVASRFIRGALPACQRSARAQAGRCRSRGTQAI